MNTRSLYLAAAAVMMMVMPLFSTGLDDLQTTKLTVDRMKLFPVTQDNLNYVFMQSIDGDTSIVIGDFSGVEKKIVMIVDQKSDNTIDAVYEYYPQTRDLKSRTGSSSKFFSKDIAKLKKDIIEGSVYKGNFTDRMISLRTLESVLNNSSSNSLYPNVFGFNVKYLESDETKNHSALFSYGKNAGGYYLQFKTVYYRKDFNTVQNPVFKYSVYCRDSKDPVVQETVENLFKVKQPGVNTAMQGR